MEVKIVRASLAGSYERLCHETGDPRFLLPLRGLSRSSQIAGLMQPKLERAIGVIYRPETELQSHYFEAVLPRQFDEYVWFDETHAVTPYEARSSRACPTLILSGSKSSMAALKDTRYVIDRLAWMRSRGIWPNGLRYLWTDAFGVVLLVSLYAELDERKYLDEAELLVAEVRRVLGRPAAFASVRHQTATVSTSTTWRCGSMHWLSSVSTSPTTGAWALSWRVRFIRPSCYPDAE